MEEEEDHQVVEGMLKYCPAHNQLAQVAEEVNHLQTTKMSTQIVTNIVNYITAQLPNKSGCSKG